MIEGRDPDVGGCQRRRHDLVWNGSNHLDSADALRSRLDRWPLGPVTDQHGADVAPAALFQGGHRSHEMDRTVPAAKGAGKHRHRRTLTGKGRPTGCSGMESVGIRPPLDFDDLRPWRIPRKDRGGWRHDQIGRRTQRLPPPPHRFEEKNLVEERLLRSWKVDDRCVHLEHRGRADRASGGDSLPAEVVVALDDDIGSDRPRDSRHGAASGPPQRLRTEWR